MLDTSVAWYPFVLLPLVLAGLAAHLVLLVGVLRRTTAGWLAHGGAERAEAAGVR